LLCPNVAQYLTLLPKFLYSLCTVVFVKVDYRYIGTESNQFVVKKVKGCS
jgi:hypothetical protein